MATSARPLRTGNHRRRSASGKNRTLLPNFFFLLPPLACLRIWIMTYLATLLEGNYSDTNITSSRWGYHKRTGGKSHYLHTHTFRFDAASTARSIRTVLPFLHWTFLPFAVQHNTSSSTGEDTFFQQHVYFWGFGALLLLMALLGRTSMFLQELALLVPSFSLLARDSECILQPFLL